MIFNAVIFDLDNTLYDYDNSHNYALKCVAKYLKIDFETFDDVYKKVSKDLKKDLKETASSHNRLIYFKHLCQEFGFNINPLNINEVYWESYISKMKLFDGVYEFLCYLKNNNIKIALLTDFQTEYQYKKLNKLGITNLFDVIVTSEEVGIEKPNTQGFERCLKLLNETADKVIMIGDNYHKDILGAINVGIYPARFEKMRSKSAYFTKEMIKYSSYKELLNLFENMKSSLDDLIILSKRYGERFDLTQAAGGNISVKFDNMMLIKPSGIHLTEVDYDNVTLIDEDQLYDDIVEGKFNPIIDYNIFSKKRASMETYMHSIIERKYVVHLHPILALRVLSRKDASDIINKIFEGYKYLFIKYVTPGIDLVKEIDKNLQQEKIIFLQNHGIIVSSDSFEEIDIIIDEILTKFNSINDNENNIFKYKMCNTISEIMRTKYSKNYVTYASNDRTLSENFLNTNFDSLFPDKIIYCGTQIVKFEDLEDNTNIDNLNDFNIIRYNNYVYITAETLKKCKEIEEVLRVNVLLQIENENLNYLDNNEEFKLLNLDSEKYRKGL